MNTIESVHVRGFRSLADFRVDDLPNVTVMIGPNGAGKSNFVRFFEMMGWMLMAPRRLARFVRWQGGADDQLFGGHARTERIEADVALRTSAGRARLSLLPGAHEPRPLGGSTTNASDFTTAIRRTTHLGKTWVRGIPRPRYSKPGRQTAAGLGPRQPQLSKPFAAAPVISFTTHRTVPIKKDDQE